MLTLRCVLMFIAICTLIEVCLFVAMLNGYLNDFEPLLTIFLDEDQLEALREFKEIESAMSGESSAASSESSSALNPAAQLALNKKFAEAVMAYDYDEARDMIKYSKVDVNFHDAGKGHLLFRLCGKSFKQNKEPPEMLKMVQLLLDHPNIDPNDEATSWSPLKAAVHAQNVQCASMILKHRDTIAQISVTGLLCGHVPHILPEIALVLPRRGHVDPCYHQHTRVLHDDDPEVVRANEVKKIISERARRATYGGAGDASSSSSFSSIRKTLQASRRNRDASSTVGGATSGSGSQQQQKQNQQGNNNKGKTPMKFNYIMDPSEFPSLFSALWFYAVGIEWSYCQDAAKVLVLIVGGHTLVVSGALAMHLSTLLAEEKQQQHQHHQQNNPQAQPQQEAAAQPVVAEDVNANNNADHQQAFHRAPEQPPDNDEQHQQQYRPPSPHDDDEEPVRGEAQ